MVSRVTLAPGAALVATAGEPLLLLLQVISRVASHTWTCSVSAPSGQILAESDEGLAGGRTNGGRRKTTLFPVGAKQVATPAAAIR